MTNQRHTRVIMKTLAATWTTVFFLWMPSLITAAELSDVCTFTSTNYSVGDVWYPRLGQHGTLHCVACVCQEGGKINCTIQNCGGPECSGSESSAENQCCARCPKVSQDSKIPTSITTPPAPAHSTRVLQENVRMSSFSLSDLSGSSTSSGVTCLHNGNVYRHKERFTSTSIGLKPEHPNQCVQCACEGGMVMCQLKDCPKADCENPVWTKDDCCPVCPDPVGRVDEMDNSPVIIRQEQDGVNGKMEDCISAGRYYLHGTTWHPVMGPFGPMDCVNCQCRSGRIECQRLECPSRPELSCERPVKVAGRCCPVCPFIDGDNQAGPVTPLLPSSPITGTRSNIQDTSRIVSSSSSSKIRTPTRPLLAPSSSSLIRSSTYHGNFTLCLPRDYDVIVYRAQGGGSTSEFIQYIFQQVVNGQGIEHHMWMLQPTVTTYKVQDLTRDQSEALRQRFRFILLGTTATKHVTRFTKREKKLKPKCLPNSGCLKKIRRLERNLVLKEVVSRKGCLPLEVEAKSR
ncbi:von Willebrand factor C and EGF domain-containing protein-like isoform X1 [Daphnia carinata]|uniref:von Willebrand factor C and EGF domain-containing protein-like isoform X1 n=1 Tax=Daphnia carinata TaxID=120202 RepID=UPI00257A5803|nr:von Willebrand factor C and EGF domain-containing protein-like isoform X1 [Daphnia carinata]